MSKTKYMTKFQLEHLKQRVSNEIDPLIEEAQLLQKSIIAELTESAELKLAKKIKLSVSETEDILYGHIDPFWWHRLHLLAQFR